MAKEKTSSVTAASFSGGRSGIEAIMGSLSDLEKEIDSVYLLAAEMKKRLMVSSNEEIEKLKQQLVSLATEEARLIVEKARAEAEAESAEIAKQADKSISSIKKNIDSTFDRAVSSIVKTIIAQPTPPVSKEPPQQEGGSRTTNAQPAPRIKRYTSDGKIVS